ncbi:Scr1 family TA system antitoxin-like transcriptional regulator [Streptomyces sp. M10(2022)]
MTRWIRGSRRSSGWNPLPSSSGPGTRLWYPSCCAPGLCGGSVRGAVPADTAAQQERRVELLRERRRRLRDRGAALWALLPAAALHTLVGDARVMAEQREELAESVHRPHTTVQVVPLGHPPHPMTGVPPLHLLRVAAPRSETRRSWRSPVSGWTSSTNRRP